MREAQKEYDWKLNFGEIAQIWRGGCIIRAAFLQKITEAYQKDPDLSNLLLDDYFKESIEKYQANWRKVISIAVSLWRSGTDLLFRPRLLRRLPERKIATKPFAGPKGLLWGTHLYERIDEPRGKHFHLDWLDPDRPEVTPSLSFRPSDYWEQSR